LTNPDAPTNLAEVVAARTASTITFTWSEGAQNGGAEILDYRVSYDQGIESFVYLQSGITSTQYTATGLSKGVEYTFRVEARNVFAYSSFSEATTILCATVPSTPSTPSTYVINSDVIVSWAAPLDNGLPITSYTVEL
jgi:large repetitive protein